LVKDDSPGRRLAQMVDEAEMRASQYRDSNISATNRLRGIGFKRQLPRIVLGSNRRVRY
jgi:bifunctional ADP-heptose synthase (sugar kinase/adenylyltransferase)